MKDRQLGLTIESFHCSVTSVSVSKECTKGSHLCLRKNGDVFIS